MKQCILILILFFLGHKLKAQPSISIDSLSISNIIKEHTNEKSPGIALGIVNKGEIVFEKYIGLANLEHQSPVDHNTRFNIASNAKQYTALCILKLKDEEKLKLNDDIRQYLPSLYPNLKDTITIKHLLNHTSGVRDYCDLLALRGKTWWKQFIDNQDVLKLLRKQQDLNFKPGTEYLYSNSNYILLAEIIKNVSGKEFSDYARTVFEELNMPNTNFNKDYMAVIPFKARPYGNWGEWKEEPMITEVHGDGSLFSNLSDQLHWEQIIQLNDGSYLTQNIIDESQNPLANSKLKSYGYGLEFDEKLGQKYSFHNGNTGAYNACFLRFPDRKTSIVIMSNNRNVPANYLAWQIAEVVLKLKNEVPKREFPSNPPRIEQFNQLSELTGIYRAENGNIIRIGIKNDTLYREIYQRESVKLIQENKGLFEYETIKGLKINFTNIGESEQQFTLYLNSQEPKTYHKISDFNISNESKLTLNGAYYNEETETEITLKHKDGNNYALVKNGKKRNAQLIADDYLRMMEIYKIRIVRDQQNNVIGLSVDRGRIKNVIFKKSN